MIIVGRYRWVFVVYAYMNVNNIWFEKSESILRVTNHSTILNSFFAGRYDSPKPCFTIPSYSSSLMSSLLSSSSSATRQAAQRLLTPVAIRNATTRIPSILPTRMAQRTATTQTSEKHPPIKSTSSQNDTILQQLNCMATRDSENNHADYFSIFYSVII